MEFLSLRNKKGGMLMLSIINVSKNFAISYVSGGLAPMFS
ncbi:hypothetical protein AC1_2119 [Clostridium perfringens B str. ATCC 3626]|uniref:Uncharacterized protein n=1 Tax=Clostridium perfringens B str. ATCC 3626 TaxID=451754 RepID=A0AAV3BN96_CLOPF|nr:hypothetical protein AC1_2119 [Clostridium perfringens B str. ATCC 3626]